MASNNAEPLRWWERKNQPLRLLSARPDDLGRSRRSGHIAAFPGAWRGDPWSEVGRAGVWCTAGFPETELWYGRFEAWGNEHPIALAHSAGVPMARSLKTSPATSLHEAGFCGLVLFKAVHGHAAAVTITLFYQRLDLPYPVKWRDCLGKGEVLANTDFNQFVLRIWKN